MMRWTWRGASGAVLGCSLAVFATMATVAFAADCNTNGIEDAADLTAGTSADCNGTNIPDECELFQRVALVSDPLGTLAGGSTLTWVLVSPERAVGDVSVTVEAVADLSATDESVAVSLDGDLLGTVFQTGATDCPATANTAALSVPRAAFNTAAADGDITIALVPGSAVDDVCGEAAFLRVIVRYDAFQDCNGNGVPDGCEADCNANILPDACDIAAGSSADCDENGVPDECEPDCDSNGVTDACDLATPDYHDCNANSVPDQCDLAGGAPDCNGNSVPDVCDLAEGVSADCDGGGVPDECEMGAGDVAVVFRQPSAETTGIYADANCKHCDPPGAQSAAVGVEMGGRTVVAGMRIRGTYDPIDTSGLPDAFTVVVHAADGILPGEVLYQESDVACERSATGVVLETLAEEWRYELTLATAVVLDPGVYYFEVFNRTPESGGTFVWGLGNAVAASGVRGTPFAEQAPGEDWVRSSSTDLSFELLAGRLGDCNGNAVLDVCEPVQADCNSNGVLDECDLDCDTSGVPDDCEIAAGTATDCDGNGLLDVCDLAAGAADCNGNDALDACDIDAGTSSDCNDNGVPDECDLANGAADCNANKVPDTCEPDTDGDGIIDACEPPDADNDGVPDADDACPGTPADATVDDNGCALIEFPIGLGCGSGAPVAGLGLFAVFAGAAGRRWLLRRQST